MSIPSPEEIHGAQEQLKVVHATFSLPSAEPHDNTARGFHCLEAMIPEIELRARALFPEIWAEHGLQGIKHLPYTLENFRTDLQTRRVVTEREPQRNDRVLFIGNGCCDRDGCPTRVFQMAVLEVIRELAMFDNYCLWCASSERLRVCNNCHWARYCGARCQRAHWRAGHRTMCNVPLDDDLGCAGDRRVLPPNLTVTMPPCPLYAGGPVSL